MEGERGGLVRVAERGRAPKAVDAARQVRSDQSRRMNGQIEAHTKSRSTSALPFPPALVRVCLSLTHPPERVGLSLSSPPMGEGEKERKGKSGIRKQEGKIKGHRYNYSCFFVYFYVSSSSRCCIIRLSTNILL